MSSTYLDCSGLHNIRCDGNDIPKSIYVDGQDFTNRFSQMLYEHENSNTNLTFRERLIIALAGNPEMICSLKEDENFIDEKITSKNLVKQADAIIEQLESEKK